MTEGSAAMPSSTSPIYPSCAKARQRERQLLISSTCSMISANNLASMKSGSSARRLLPSRNSSRATISLWTGWWVRILGAAGKVASGISSREIRGLPAGWVPGSRHGQAAEVSRAATTPGAARAGGSERQREESGWLERSAASTLARAVPTVSRGCKPSSGGAAGWSPQAGGARCHKWCDSLLSLNQAGVMHTAEANRDFFISYTSSDRAWANGLLPL